MRRLSPANARYLARMAVAMLAYVGVLYAVDWGHAHARLPDGPVRYLIAAAPALPVFVAIWAMMRFSGEEEDEYQRHLHNRAILWAMALTLSACVLGGLMQRYADVGPVNLLDVFNVFWLALLATTVWVQVRASR